MDNPFKTNVKPKDIKLIAKDTVEITSTGLLNALVRSKTDALKKIKTDIGPVTIDKILIDDNGRILIKDARFRDLIEKKLAQPTAANSNTVCNNAFCPKK